MPGRTTPPAPEEPPRVMFWRLRRNPLRRRSDLLQGGLGIGLALAVLAATPFAMFLIGNAVRHHYTRTAQHQAATLHPTTATLVEDVPHHPEPGSAEAEHARYPATVRFTDPRGRTRTAEADVRPALEKGSTIRVWASTDGKITGPPLSSGQIRDRTVASAVITALSCHATAAVVYIAVHRLVQRRNLGAWEAAWAETAPRWNASP